MRVSASRKFARVLVLIAAGAIGIGQVIAQADDSSPVFPFAIEKTALDNGLTLMSIPFDSPGIIAYYTIVRTGSRNEVEKGLSGFAHFFEHMMFRGTEKYSQEAYNNVLKSMGADSNASTSDDWTIYYMTIPASALGKAVEIVARGTGPHFGGGLGKVELDHHGLAEFVLGVRTKLCRSAVFKTVHDRPQRRTLLRLAFDQLRDPVDDYGTVVHGVIEGAGGIDQAVQDRHLKAGRIAYCHAHSPVLARPVDKEHLTHTGIGGGDDRGKPVEHYGQVAD